MMSETVSKALREARMKQQELRNQINALVDDSHATSLRELKAERKQLQGTYSKGLGAVKSLEDKLALLQTNAQSSLKSLDEAQRQHAVTTEDYELAQSALEAASPEHLRERMNAAKLKRVEATGVKERAEGYLASGAASLNLIQRRVDESKARIDRLESDRIARSERIDTLSAQRASDEILLKEKKDEQAVFLEAVSYTHLTLPTKA